MTSIEIVIRDAQALVADGHTSSPDLAVTTVKLLARLFFLKYYEQHMPSHASHAVLQEMIEYNDTIDAALAQIKLNNDKYQRLLPLIDTFLLQKQPSANGEDGISHFYSSLVALLTPQHKATGAYPTPQPIARFMAKITDPKPTDMKIYDPACGTCSLLVAAHTNIASHSEKEPIKSLFFGCDNDPNILPLGKMNMALHTIDSAVVQLQDALAQPPSTAPGSNPQQLSFLNELDTSTIAFRPVQEVDVILTHPPHGRYKNLHSQTTLVWYDSQFLQHCMNTLKENGRCAIVVSDRTLSDPQKKHTELRRELFTKFSIQLIVALPPETFGPLSSQKTYLLFFIASQSTQKALHYELPRKKGPVEYEDFRPILDIWKDWSRYLKNEVQLLVLPKGMRIAPYEDLHYAELLRAQGEITKNPYKLYRPPPPQKYSPPADPKTLVGQILQHNQEIREIALELQALLNQKEFLS